MLGSAKSRRGLEALGGWPRPRRKPLVWSVRVSAGGLRGPHLGSKPHWRAAICTHVRVHTHSRCSHLVGEAADRSWFWLGRNGPDKTVTAFTMSWEGDKSSDSPESASALAGRGRRAELHGCHKGGYPVAQALRLPRGQSGEGVRGGGCDGATEVPLKLCQGLRRAAGSHLALRMGVKEGGTLSQV